MNAAVFLDRDNTLIHNDGDLGRPDQVRIIQGAASAIASLRGLGYKVIVVTNQGGVARGKYTESDVEAVHNRINELVRGISGASIDRFYYCPYHPEASVERYRGDHPWRKPQPGMLLQAAKDLELDLGQSWMIGDQARDVEAGRAAGVRTILLDENAEELTPLRLEGVMSAQVQGGPGGPLEQPHFEARNLIEAVRIIAQQRKPETPEEAKARERTARRWDAAGSKPAPTARVPSPPPQAGPARERTPSRPPRHAHARGPSVGDAPPPHGDAPIPAAHAPPAAPVEAVRPTQPAVLLAPPAPASEPRSEALLRQVLQEIRSQRGATDDFSYLRVVAIVAQMIAAVGLLTTLIMGRNDLQVFLVCLGVSIMFQLGTIAVLLFERR